MASNPQIPSESPADQVLIAPNPPKSMAGKYDGRKRKVKIVTRERSGPKPHWERHLGRNTAAKLFRSMSVQDRMLELLQTKNDRLRFDILCYVWDRLEGRPFLAENPNAARTPNVLNQDNRLQIAIQQLVPAKQGKKKKTKGVIEASSEAKLLTEANSEASNVVEGEAQVVDSTQDGSK